MSHSTTTGYDDLVDLDQFQGRKFVADTLVNVGKQTRYR